MYFFTFSKLDSFHNFFRLKYNSLISVTMKHIQKQSPRGILRKVVIIFYANVLRKHLNQGVLFDKVAS